jgi:hypothetical protein
LWQQLVDDVLVESVVGVAPEQQAVFLAVGQDEQGQAGQVLGSLDLENNVPDFVN